MQNSKVKLTKIDKDSLISQLEQQRHLIDKLVQSQQLLTKKVQLLLQAQGTQPKQLPDVNANNISQSALGAKTKNPQILKDIPTNKLSNLPFYKQFDESIHYAEYDLSKSKADQLLGQFNQTTKQFSANKPLNKLFEEMAAKNQDYPAIVFEKQFLSFGELNHQANQLAHYLITRGVSEGENVGIMLPKSLDMVVAILAILKAGCTYIPLSPNETTRRLQYIVHNTRMQAVVTLSEIVKGYSFFNSELLKFIQLDVEKGGMAEMEAENLNLASPSTPACILFSSSPIAPVGTPFHSKTILNELNWFWQNYPYSKSEICCSTAPLYRAEFIYDFWGPLLKGVPNVLISQKVLVDPPVLIDYLNDIRARRIQLPPTVLRLMLQAYPNLGGRLPLLKTWFLRGEIVHKTLLESFLKSAKDKQVIGLYNITESGGVAAFQNLSNLNSQYNGFILGTPIYNTRIFLLDDKGFQVKPGGVGQILVSSIGTESGYHNNTSFTGNFFAKDKLSAQTSARGKLFRTGDYGRMTADGKLEYLGRKDKRIKVYGRRLDLDNIAKVLHKQPQVKEAVIEASHNKLGQLAITAFLLVADQTYSIQNWRKYLLNQIPQFMVPTKIYQVRTNDRDSSLPLHDETMRLHMIGKRKQEAEREAKLPRDQIEKQLLKVWVQILNRNDVFIHDDFFELGGNQILTRQLASHIQKEFEISLEPETVYRKPTISELAVLIREAWHIKDRVDSVSAAEFVESFTQKMKAINKEATKENNKLLEIQKGLPTKPKFFCVHGEDGDIAYLRHWIKYLGEQPFYAFQARTIIDGKKEGFTSVQDIAASYVTELRKIQPRGPYYLGGFSSGGIIAFEMAQQLLKTGEQVALLSLIDSVNQVKNQKQSFFRDRFENLAAAPASYLNGVLFKKLAGRAGQSESGLDTQENLSNQTVISPNFRSVIFESYLKELIDNYEISPFSGSILLITSTESGTLGPYASVDRGWKGYSLSLKIHEIQGDQTALITEPNAKKVVNALLGHIDAVSKRMTLAINQ